MNVIKLHKNPLNALLCLLLLLLPDLVCSQGPDINFDIFRQENGLANNQVQCIYQDNRGWIWIGTSQGLSRFDGYNFVNFLPDPNDSTSLKGNLVRVITESASGQLLVGTETGGLNVFDRENESFIQPCKNHDEFKLKEVAVNDIVTDEKGALWIGTDYNVLIVDTSWNVRVLTDLIESSNDEFAGNFVRHLRFDTTGKLWLGTNNGLYVCDPETLELNRFELPFGDNTNREIWEIYIDDDGEIWVGTYSSGLFIINPESHDVRLVQLNPEIPRTETVKTISKGAFGEFWIGTRGGLFTYSKKHGVTAYYKKRLQNPGSLSNNSILCVFQDAKGETWVGTRGGLNLLAKSKQVFHHFGALPGNDNYLNSSIVYAFWIDSQGRIWIGTEDGGINIYDRNRNRFTYLTADDNDPNSISQNCIKSFLDDGKGNLWVGTFLGGINRIDLETGKISHFKHNPELSGVLSDNRVWDICLDKHQDIWVATSKGVDKFDRKTQKFIHYPQLNGMEQTLWIEKDSRGNLWMGSNDEVIVFNPKTSSIRRFHEHSRSMYEDTKNRIWIATKDRGFASYSGVSGAIKYYGEDDGLSNNQALCIVEDLENNLWISTSNGLSKFSPLDESFQNYSSKDGLGNNQFCYGAAYKTDSGEILFGSVDGFNLFKPSETVAVDSDVPMVFTDLKVFNKSLNVGEGDKPVLSKSLSETGHLTLNYKQDVFTLEFAALNYVNSTNNLYKYKLEGFNRDWIGPSKDRNAHFTNLNPGTYTLRVKQVFRGKAVEGKELLLGITILPPFWKTSWFLVLIIIVTAGLFFMLIRFVINREKIKNQLVLERVNAKKLHELDMMKLKFFTNISHEIRTPLTLILGPLEKMLQNGIQKESFQDHLKLMHRNAQNLDKLINQLLDFRKMQTGNLRLNLTEADLVNFLRNLVNSFSSYAQEREIKLAFNTLKKRLFVAFDPDKIEKILNNLLSNAFKFTQAGGAISVNLSLVFDAKDDDFSEENQDQQFIEISVKDTGMGISNTHINRIFNRFFQTDENDQNQGSGIGLALVKELVRVHNGNIFVSSKPGMGTKFTIRIPCQQGLEKSEVGAGDENLVETNRRVLNGVAELQHAKVMLVIEDNSDVRMFIHSHFSSMYRIYEASDGEEGWKIALETIPDIIVSDIIMPKVNGYELCKRLKDDERTSHIPVLLLTAMHSKEHELKGISSGADDYITKPFDISVLEAKVDNMLSVRSALKEKYTSRVVLEPTNVVITSPDERFLQRAIGEIEKNISDSELDIEKFAKLVGVSRMQLYRKLNALTNMTVKEFIRHIRLKRAAQLLSQKKMNISEIAYEVGFKDLSHFRKCFKREYGVSATEYITRLNSN